MLKTGLFSYDVYYKAFPTNFVEKQIRKEMLFLLLQDILEGYLYHLQVQNYSHRTVKGYKNNNLAFFRYIKEDFNIEELEKVRAQHISIFHVLEKTRQEVKLCKRDIEKCTLIFQLLHGRELYHEGR